jgi:hypothetical protein
MAASAWTIFDRAKHKIATSTMPLSGGIFRLSLHRTSASANLTPGVITIFSEIGDQCSGGGYVARTLSGVAWTDGASAGQQKWDASDPVITASASILSGVRFAVIRLSAGTTTSGHLLCFAALSTAQFNVTTGNTLTIQMASTGIFTLT